MQVFRFSDRVTLEHELAMKHFSEQSSVAKY